MRVAIPLLLVISLSAGAAVAQPTAQTPSATITYDDIRKLAPQALAHRLLLPDKAERVVSDEIRYPSILHPLYITLQESAHPFDMTFCARTVHVFAFAPVLTTQAENVPLKIPKPLDGTEYGSAWPETATPARCAEIKGFVAVSPQRRDLVFRTFSRLTDAMNAAAGSAPLPFRLECYLAQSPGKTEACADARQALARLPLDKLAGVEIHDSSLNGQILVPENGLYVQRPVPPDWEPDLSLQFRPGSAGGTRAWGVIPVIKEGKVDAIRLVSSQVFDW